MPHPCSLLFTALLVLPLSVGTASGPAAARTATTAERGQALAQAHCARCHAIGRRGASPVPAAPPFRTLHTRYPVEQLAEALAVLAAHTRLLSVGGRA